MSHSKGLPHQAQAKNSNRFPIAPGQYCKSESSMQRGGGVRGGSSSLIGQKCKMADGKQSSDWTIIQDGNSACDWTRISNNSKRNI